MENIQKKFVKLIYFTSGPFLHGELEVDIQEARDLPDTDNFMFNIKNCFGQEKDVTDPYVAVCLDNTRIITTSVCLMYPLFSDGSGSTRNLDLGFCKVTKWTL